MGSCFISHKILKCSTHMNSKKSPIVEKHRQIPYGDKYTNLLREIYIKMIKKKSLLSFQNTSWFHMISKFSASYIKLRKVSVTI